MFVHSSRQARRYYPFRRESNIIDALSAVCWAASIPAMLWLGRLLGF